MIIGNEKRKRRRKRDPVADLKQQWGAAIRAQRELLGMTQRQLADAIKVDQSAVSLWEKGAKAPTVEHQLAVARALKVAPRILFAYPAEASA
jgi:transcriptional regulator with XRE-family HTH domain